MIGRTEKKEEREGECSPLQGEPVFFKPVRELACQCGEKGGEAELCSTLCAEGFRRPGWRSVWGDDDMCLNVCHGEVSCDMSIQN